LAVVRNGNVGVEENGIINVFHGSTVLLKHSIFLLFLVFLHILGHLFEICHFILSYLFLKTLLFSKS